MDQCVYSHTETHNLGETDHLRHILQRPPCRLLPTIRHSARPHRPPSPLKSLLRPCSMSRCCRLDRSNDIMALVGSTHHSATLHFRSRISPPLGRINSHRPIRNPDRHPLWTEGHRGHILENAISRPIPRSSPRCYSRRQDRG